MSSSPRRICVAVVISLAATAALISSPVATTTAASLPPSPPPNSIAGIDNHTCVVNADATVSCWGENSYGQPDTTGWLL